MTDDRAELVRQLETLETIFEANGGRGVEDAEEIDRLRGLLYPDEGQPMGAEPENKAWQTMTDDASPAVVRDPEHLACVAQAEALANGWRGAAERESVLRSSVQADPSGAAALRQAVWTATEAWNEHSVGNPPQPLARAMAELERVYFESLGRRPDALATAQATILAWINETYGTTNVPVGQVLREFLAASSAAQEPQGDPIMPQAEPIVEALAKELAFFVVTDRQRADRTSPEHIWSLPSALWAKLDESQKDGWRTSARAIAARIMPPTASVTPWAGQPHD